MICCESIIKYYERNTFLKISSQISATIFFFSSHFRQWHCHNSIQFFFPFSAMPLPQLPIFFSFFSYFGNGIATIANFFFSYFGNAIATFGFPCAHSHFENPLGQQVWVEGISVMVLPKIKNFPLPLFLFLSPIFVEFRQYCCRNFFSFLNSPINFKQYL